MTLKQLIEIIIITRLRTSPNEVDNLTITGSDLIPYKELINSCEEFSECKELIIIEEPTFYDNSTGKGYTTNSYKYYPENKFRGTVRLYSLSTTPEMYDPSSIHKPVKDGAVITPVMYDPTNFQPIRDITIRYYPEIAEQNSEVERKYLHKILDKVLDNMNEYTPKGQRGLVIRMVCDSPYEK